MSVIGLDIGGTKINAGIVRGKLLGKFISIDTDNQAKKDVIIRQVTDTIDKLFNKSTKAIGIGVPSIVDTKKGIVYEANNIPSWNKIDLKKILKKKYKVPIYINNDANCFALGESLFGKGKHHKNIVAVTLGTGLGAGIVINKALYEGKNCNAGEFGMIPYKNHTVEHYCSGKLFLHHGFTGKFLAEQAKNKNKKALKLFSIYGSHLGNALSIIINSLDPDIIILGGSISKSYKFFSSAMRESLKKSLYKKTFSNINIVTSNNPYTTVLGAASLCR